MVSSFSAFECQVKCHLVKEALFNPQTGAVKPSHSSLYSDSTGHNDHEDFPHTCTSECPEDTVGLRFRVCFQSLAYPRCSNRN